MASHLYTGGRAKGQVLIPEEHRRGTVEVIIWHLVVMFMFHIYIVYFGIYLQIFCVVYNRK